MDQYDFLDGLMLRTPLISYQDYHLDAVSKIINDVSFKAALFLANPSLYQLIAAKHFDWELLTAKEKLTITRYYNRMCFRPTPFGGFAAFSVAHWGKDKSSPLIIDGGNHLHLWLDQYIAFRLAQALADQHPDKLHYILNPTIYKVNGELRLIKTVIGEKPKFTFSIEAMDDNRLIAGLLKFISEVPRSGRDISVYIEQLTGCDNAEALDYFDFLVDAQIIKSVWDSNITGEDHLGRLLNNKLLPDTIFKKNLAGLYKAFSGVRKAEADVLIHLQASVNRLLPEITDKGPRQVFYSGLEGKIISGTLTDSYQQNIREGLKALQLLVQPAQPPALQQFITDFKNRYDRRSIPLLQALDPETGVGYGGLATDIAESDLLKDVKFSSFQNHPVSVNWTGVHRLLFSKWCANTRMDLPLVLSDQDILDMESTATTTPLPASFPVMFRIFENQVFLESAGGASANSLIGRFTFWSKEVWELSKHIASLEQAANPEVIFAEIGQISDHHADNINRREQIYPFEIPVNVVSTLPLAKQLRLSDLVLTVYNDELILESLSLKQRVMPRLSSAYNYNHNQLAAFRLLCDLQYQGVQANLTLDMEGLFPGMAFYPRVVYNRTILCLAKWYISAQEIRHLTEGGMMVFLKRLVDMKVKLDLPDMIAITRFDQQLVFNLERKEDQLLFLDCVKGAEGLILQEYPIAGQAAVFQTAGRPLIGQFIAFLKNTQTLYTSKPGIDLSGGRQQERDYMLGSKWVYLKIYCHPAAANDLLVNKILPKIRVFEPHQVLSWFFIRYIDTGHHIRLRLRISDGAIGMLLDQFKDLLAGSLHYQLIREYQADTYRREMERYGHDMIEQAEDLFNTSSNLVLTFIKRSFSRGFVFSYHSLAFVSVCRMVEAFWLSLDDQLTFLQQMSNTFYAEFSSDKSLRIDLDQKYRELKKEITKLLKDHLYFKQMRIGQWADLFGLKQQQIADAARAFSTQRKTQLAADLIHMHLNRLFAEKQRNQELIVYYCLYKHKLAERAVKGKL
jgi:thiopeptide-type bacteriocin biosynthesis protein